MSREKLIPIDSQVIYSEDVSIILERVEQDGARENLPDHLRVLFDYLLERQTKAASKLPEGSRIFGPDWCRQNPRLAGELHSRIIIDTYGATYALPNKDPEANEKALIGNEIEMYLLCDGERPVGTACMVIQENGWAELGRSASLGGVGNEFIQNLRILDWLVNPDLSARVVGLFATCRTAPDRNIGTNEEEVMMRGGQAVSHIWKKMPSVMVGGFGPLYKKHGSLEQFAYLYVTNKSIVVPDEVWVTECLGRDLISGFVSQYHIETQPVVSTKRIDVESAVFGAGYPPIESGITELVHGEVFLGGSMKLIDAIDELVAVEVPFIQVPVPVDCDTISIQEKLLQIGFQPFIFVPGIDGGPSPMLWFGRKRNSVAVVPTYWDTVKGENPFWGPELSNIATEIASKW